MSTELKYLVLGILLVIALIRAYPSIRDQDWRNPAQIRVAIGGVLGILITLAATALIATARQQDDVSALRLARLIVWTGLGITFWAVLRWFFSDALQPPYLRDYGRFKEVTERLDRQYPKTPEGERQHLQDLEYMRLRMGMFPGEGPERQEALQSLSKQIEDLRRSTSRLKGA